MVLDIDTNHPRRTFRVRDLTTGQVIMRQATIWHLTADAGETVSSDTATRGGGARHGHYSPRPKKTSHYTYSLGSREAVSEEPESEQHEPEGAGGSEGAFELERAEHETGGAFGPEGTISEALEPKKSLLPEPDCYGPKKKFSAELAAKVFEQCQTVPCVFKRVLRGKVVVIIVVYVDDVLVASETKRGEEHLVASLTATPRSGVRSGVGTVFTPHRIQCGMLNLD